MEESKGKKFSNWMQDNLQAIIIIAIALFILFFLIYSYSKKSNPQDTIVDDNTQQEEVISEIPADENTDSKNDSKTETATTTPSKTASDNNQNKETTSPANNYSENNDRGKGPSPAKTEVKNNNSQQSKDGTITVTANYGESLTHLARKATAQYISENNVTGLTPAHKVYIEDTLQKNISNRVVTPGVSVSFSNESISSAIDSANSLNDYQLQNLNGYATYVSGL